MKLLIIRPAALGDSLMLMPSLCALRGTADTVVVGRRPGIDFLSPYVRQAMDYESHGWHLLYAQEPDGIPALPLPAMDLAVLFHADPDGEMASRLKAFLPGAEVRVFPGFPQENSETHAALHLAACLEKAGCSINANQAFEEALHIPLLSRDTPLKNPENAELSLRAQRGNLTDQGLSKILPRRFSRPNNGIRLFDCASNQSVLGKNFRRIILHPGSGSHKKNHLPQFWLDFAGHLSASHPFPLTVLVGPAEESLLPFFQHQFQAPDKEILFCPERTTLLSTLSQAAIYAGQDSGITHLAAMAGAPTLALFRSTSISQWRPLGPRVRIIAHDQSGPALLDEALAKATELIG